MPTTIYESFTQALHGFRECGIQVEVRGKSSGKYTHDSEPPNCAIGIPLKHWTEMAEKCLEKHKHDLAAKYLPEIRDTIEFKSEADVVKASALYLIQPVEDAYRLAHPGDICLDELTKGSSSRVDSAYFSGPPDNKQAPGSSSNIFTVLEYKKFKSLSRKHFKFGIVSEYKHYRNAQEIPRFADTDSNTEIILKQATHYSWAFGTPFVALCDYNTLVLLFINIEQDKKGGPHAYMTVVTDSREMRKAYLGFLLAARSYEERKTSWRLDKDGADILATGEGWQRKFYSGTPVRNPERESRNKDEKKYLLPGSSDIDSDSSDTKIQSG
ncbi:hypothetical protein DHEL01_v202642 [Diaporthe helianthi]|uniref:Uncharacterized protein n=1 Tax=Diaporthe helianthi TaxID=158607 RepID=A0A2P5I8X6_DIAHE|nr:hypothetical protein DHEL01_v202642 [Diaporthe helianthi]